MSRNEYYETMRALAREKRAEFNVETATLNLHVMRRIYRSEGIRLDSWPLQGWRVRAAYFNDENGASVLVKKDLPREPKLFALAHELKHHFVDRPEIADRRHECAEHNQSDMIEVGADVFAAEFIYPEEEIRALAIQLEIQSGAATPELVVRFKHECRARISYQSLVKSLARLGFLDLGMTKGIQWTKLEESIFGTPIHKQEWFQKNRAARKGRRLPAK
jgi:Zn-dependent peptidase ImmA (M78 family)